MAKDQLIEEASVLLESARRVQDEAEPLSERAAVLENVSDEYHAWYRSALSLFNTYDSMGERQKFEEEYQGSFLSPKINDFLTSGLEDNPLYNSDSSGLMDRWTYPYARCFKAPLLKQTNLLAGLQKTDNPLEGGVVDNEWNETICRVFRAFIERADEATTNNDKKLTYEYLAFFLIGAIEGFKVLALDRRGLSKEVDLWVSNEAGSNFWQRIGNPFIVECKNWGEPVGVQQIRNLDSVMASSNVQFAILLSKNGVTGEQGREAANEIRNAFQKERYIVVLDKADLLEIASGIHPEKKIKDKHYALYMSS